jgi:integrase
MAPEPLSRTGALTLADALTAVRAADLPARRRQEICSALSTVANVIGRPPDRVAVEPRQFAARLAEIAPGAHGISRGRWNNVRCLARAGLALVQPMSPGRHQIELIPSWRALLKQLKAKSTKIAVSRFLRYCSAQGIEPEAVTESTFAAFRKHLDDTLLKDPEAVYASTVRGWKAAQAAVEKWPRLAVDIPDRRRIWTLPWTAFPPSLRDDVEAWLQRLAGCDLLEEVPFRPARPSTVAHRERQIRSFASALVLGGRDPATIASLRDLVEIEAFKEGLRFFIKRNGEPSTAIENLATALKSIARHHLRLEPAQLERIGAIIRKLQTGRRGLTKTNRARLRPLDDWDNAVALLQLPIKLMSIASRNRHPRRAAIQAQIAAAIEILLMAPLRIGNLVSLDIEQNLVRPGRGKALHIVVEPENVKNREPLEYPPPPQSIDLIERYLNDFRPRLACSGSTAFFPGEGGRPKRRHTLGKQISDTVHAYTGMRMHPHLFRHATSKLFLDSSPGAYEVVRRVLGHRSIDTTTAYYTGLETPSAVRHFDETLLRIRQGKGRRQ